MRDQRSSPGPRPGRRGAGYWLLALLSILGVGLAVLVATFLFGQHGGEEFCPDTFSRRTFFYFQIPLVGIQVTPIFRDDATNSLENYLIANRLVETASATTPRWDLVRAVAAGSETVRGDAEIMCHYLDATDAQNHLFWQAWSDDHQESAKQLWPLVATLARQQLYLLVPELFDLASAESDPDRLAGQLNQSLARQYLGLAKIQQQLGRHKAALELLEHAREHGPADTEVQRCREVSLRAIGKAVLEAPAEDKRPAKAAEERRAEME